MGTPKGLLTVDDMPLLSYHARCLRPYASEILIVLGAYMEQHLAVLPDDVGVVHNPDWATTDPLTSLQLALRLLKAPSQVLVLPVDTPPAAESTLQALLRAPGSAVPRDQLGREGHPVSLDEGTIHDVCHTPLSGGLRAHLRQAYRVEVPDPWVSVDFDTPDAWNQFVTRWPFSLPTGS